MIRIFIFTIIFFILEISFITNYLNNLYQKDIWQINFKDDSQRRVFKVMQDISKIKYDSTFIFGGSSSREFFLSNKYMSQVLHRLVYNCAVSNQTAYDSLKLQLIVKPNSIIIYGLHIKSLMDPDFDYSQIENGYYFGGLYYKYPIVLDDNINNRNVSYVEQLSPIINTYIYLFKEYMNKHSWKNIYNGNIVNNKIPKQYHYSGRPLSINVINKKLQKYFMKLKNNKTRNLSINFSIIEQMIIQAKKNNNKFVLYELPFSPIIQDRFKPYFKEYYKNLNILLKKYPDIVFISNKNFPVAKQKYFYDTIHLLPSGREYYKNSIIKNLKKVINNVK